MEDAGQKLHLVLAVRVVWWEVNLQLEKNASEYTLWWTHHDNLHQLAALIMTRENVVRLVNGITKCHNLIRPQITLLC